MWWVGAIEVTGNHGNGSKVALENHFLKSRNCTVNYKCEEAYNSRLLIGVLHTVEETRPDSIGHTDGNGDTMSPNVWGCQIKVMHKRWSRRVLQSCIGFLSMEGFITMTLHRINRRVRVLNSMLIKDETSNLTFKPKTLLKLQFIGLHRKLWHHAVIQGKDLSYQRLDNGIRRFLKNAKCIYVES